jgi:type IV pilus assembly protein PilV
MKLNRPRRNHRQKAQAGFSMVEVLVSLLLMTISLLGISGLMLSGVNNSTGFDLASRASQSANEIMDAMRANSTNAAAYVTAYGTNAATLTGTTPADADRKQWLETVKRLPGGDGKIEENTPSPGVYQVSIRFANCLGSLSTTELTNCTTTSSDNEKRVIFFQFRI